MVDEVSGAAITEQELPDQADETTVSLINNKSGIVATGKLKKGNLELNVADQPNGFYIVKITSQGKVTSKQVMVKH